MIQFVPLLVPVRTELDFFCWRTCTLAYLALVCVSWGIEIKTSAGNEGTASVFRLVGSIAAVVFLVSLCVSIYLIVAPGGHNGVVDSAVPNVARSYRR